MLTQRYSLFIACLMAADAALGQTPTAEGLTFSFDGGVQVIQQKQAFWGLAQAFSPGSGYKSDYTWTEVYAKPGISFKKDAGEGREFFGAASVLAAHTGSTDLFQQGSNNKVLLEDGYVGLRQKQSDHASGYSFSVGAQPYRLGHGLLLANAGGNGFENSALVFAPRRSWEMAALAKLNTPQWTLEAFYLDAHELKSGDTNTKLAGANAIWTPAPGHHLGLAHFRVTDSTAPYPKAPVQIIENARDGLQTTDLHWRYEPTQGAMAGFSATGELALQRNPRIDMRAKGLGVEFGYRFTSLPFVPRLSYSGRYFSGDDPATSGRLERFDALFYDGAPPTWSSGGSGSFAFYNSNLTVHRFRVDLVLSPRDYLNVSFWDVRAAKANSPVQYGQAARLNITGGQVGLVSGFPVRSLSKEVYVEYTRVLNQNLFVTAGLALALPQEGVQALLPNGSKRWVGALANVVYRF